MNIPSNFTFFGVRKTLPQGIYEGIIKDFNFQEKTSKAGKPYVTIAVVVEINNQNYPVQLALDPKEKDKSLYKLIQQLIPQSGMTEEALIEACANPVEFFNICLSKKITVVSTEKGYLDVWSKESVQATPSDQKVDPSSIPF